MVSAWISTYEQGLRGSASPEDLETMLQLAWLRALAPRYDADAIASMKKRIRTYFENRLASPGQVFGDRFTEVLYDGHPRTAPLTPERIDGVDPEVAFDFYRQRMANPGTMTFFLVGNIDPERTRTLASRWLAPLPTDGEKENWQDLGLRPVKGQKSFTVYKGIEPKSSVRFYMHQPAEWTAESAHMASSVAAALRITLREILREEMGGTYGVSVSGYISRRPEPTSVFQVSFQCAPENAQALVEAMQKELDRFVEEGVEEEVAVKVREGQRRNRETSLQENGFWRGLLTGAVRYDRNPEHVNQYDSLIELVTPETLREAAGGFLDRSNSVLGILYPESFEKEEGS